MNGAESFLAEQGLDIHFRTPHVSDFVPPVTSAIQLGMQLFYTPGHHTAAAPQPVNPSSPLPEAHIRQLQLTPPQPQPIETLMHGYPLNPGSDPMSEPEPEPSSEREPLSVLLDNIETLFLAFNDCNLSS